MEKESFDRPFADLRGENEILRIQLELEHGAHFGKPEGAEAISPELENEWLQRIAAFEKMHEQPTKEVSVHDFCGSPSYKAIEELQPNELSDALKSLSKAFASNGLSLDTCAPVDDEIMYRFITEKFFFHMIADIRVPGMKHCFIYEEFFDE